MIARRFRRGGASLLAFLGSTFPLGLPAPPAAAAPSVEIGIQGGLHAPDEHLTGEQDFLDELVATGGLRAGLTLSGNLGIAADGLVSETKTGFPEGDARVATLRAAVEWFPVAIDEDESRFFLSAGGGWMDVDLAAGDSSDFGRPFASVGVGQRAPLGDRMSFRWELRGDATYWEHEDVVWVDMIQAELLVGLSLRLGGSRDADRDGVSDGRDECPGTPVGALVNGVGCPTDEDGDGVWDGLDLCPGTAAGATVDGGGCPSDTDGDGVWDGLDRCADTPVGAEVDARGCPSDADGDGVWDGLDRCPGTPAGATVDANGCPSDTDGDGVYDGLDRCPGTPAGAEVDVHGCPKLFEDDRAELVLEGVTFESNRDVLTVDSKARLDEVAAALKAWPDVNVEIGGHTDSAGSASRNLELSELRANAVMRHLIDAGVSFTQLTAKGYGSSMPIADNATPEGRAANRRVELKKAQ